MSRRFTFGILALVSGVLFTSEIARSSLISQNAHALMCMARLAQVAQAAVYYVKSNATGTPHDGSNWNQAFTDLPTAVLNAGNVSGQTDELWVAAVANSPYKPTSGTDRTLSIPMKTRVEIYGGFVGNESVRTQRDWVANETILSGDLSNNDQPNFVNRTDNSLHVVVANSVASTAVLDGFTVTGGRADGTTTATRTGAGLYIFGTNSSPRIVGTTIISNEVLNLSGAGGTGGGVGATSNGGSPTFIDCLVSNNKAGSSGGGCYLDSPLLATFTRCAFMNNFTSASSDTGGGALLTTVQGTLFRKVVLDECTFEGNFTTAAPGGAIYHQGTNNTLEARGCVFESNTANGGAGGAIYLASESSSKLIDSQFLSNECHESVSPFGGGAVAIVGSGPTSIHTIINGAFLENVANSPTEMHSNGGALHTIKSAGGISITNTLFARNHGYNGSAINCGTPTNGLVFTNVTVTDNHTYTGGNVGGIALLVEQFRTATIANSILYGNTDGSGNDGTDAQIEAMVDADGTLTVSYSCIKDGYTGTGNIGANPLFVDPANGNESLRDYRLQPCSLASDGSDYDAVPADAEDVDDDANISEKTPDLDKLDRAVDNPHVPPDGSPFTYPDMGAYENNAVAACATLGDLEVDSTVDGLDIQPFTDCVVAPTSGCACADLDLSGTITLADVPYFVQCLLTEGQNCGVVCVAGLRSYPDCNTNGVPDINDIFNRTSQDCNHNDVPDECDLDEGDPDGNELVSADVNTNSIPDECDPDCNTNGVPDDWDLSQATSDDVNTNGVPDECEADCNTNGVPDAWDISQATSADCNTNGTPDECEADCNTNGVPDDCDIDPGDPDGDEWVSADCNGNGMPDECDLALPGGWGSLDCNTNGIPDECDIASCEGDPACGDCNENGIPDGCDIAAEVSEDANTNGIPDECEGEEMMGGGSQMMMGGGEGEGESSWDEEAAWEAYYEWTAAQCWGPACETPTDVQFAAMVAKLQELGLPVSGRPTGP